MPDFNDRIELIYSNTAILNLPGNLGLETAASKVLSCT